MKISKFVNVETSVAKAAKRLVEVEAVKVSDEAEPQQHQVIFPASDRFKHMLSLISRDNKELYNRIVGLD